MGLVSTTVLFPVRFMKPKSYLKPWIPHLPHDETWTYHTKHISLTLQSWNCNHPSKNTTENPWFIFTWRVLIDCETACCPQIDVSFNYLFLPKILNWNGLFRFAFVQAVTMATLVYTTKFNFPQFLFSCWIFRNHQEFSQQKLFANWISISHRSLKNIIWGNGKEILWCFFIVSIIGNSWKNLNFCRAFQ